MKTRLFPTLVLLAVLVAACAPAPATLGPALPKVVDLQPSATSIANPVGDNPIAPAIATATMDPGVSASLPIATSRGPNLEATDPSTVSLASGQVQFVEFFRFT